MDYLDYDEVAHHAGILRPESLAALEAIDGTPVIDLKPVLGEVADR